MVVLKTSQNKLLLEQPGEKTQITAVAKDKAKETLEDQGCTVEVSDLYEVLCLCLFLYNYVHIFQFSDKLIITITLNVLDESRALAEVLFRL